MTDLMKQLTARMVERRRQLAALPVGEKLRMLEEMVAAAEVIGATRPPKPANPVMASSKMKTVSAVTEAPTDASADCGVPPSGLNLSWGGESRW